MTLDVDTFARFYEEVHGYPPFPWQDALARKVLAEGWPDVIDVPTGLGKTSVLDIAVFALAADSAAAGPARRAATRTFFVVDRRVIVDAAYEHAESLASALAKPEDRPTTTEVAQVLQALAGPSPAKPLDVVRMRGGVTWDWRWARGPDQPLVVVGTVDQFGSRLLFRGYGVGPHLRPLDAALTGTDALVLLDEAHIANPLLQTVEGVRDYESRAETAPIAARSLRTVQLSATARSADRTVFSIDVDRELENAASARRLTAFKRAALVSLPFLRAGRKAERGGVVEPFAEAVASLARGLLTDPTRPRVVGVVLNTVPMARAVYRRLEGTDRVLLVGRCRQYERDQVLRRYRDRMWVGRDRPTPSSLAVVATQTVEVGVDIDFDALVTEVAPFDALVQRFGRVDRVGDLGDTSSMIVHAPFRHGEDAPVYGRAVAQTWKWLTEAAGGATEVARAALVDTVGLDGPSFDFGTLVMRDASADVDRDLLVAAPPPTPVLLGPTVRAWARTEPIPLPDQPVAPYLHGVERGDPEVAVCWRVDRDSGALSALPPVADELVSVPIGEVQRFLGKLDVVDALSDAESGTTLPTEEQSSVAVKAVVYNRREVRPITRPGDVRPGDVVVVDAKAGGHDEFGWTGETGQAVADIGDLVHRRGRRCLRLDARSLALFLPDSAVQVESVIARAVKELTDGDDERAPKEIVHEVLGKLAELCTGDGPYVEELRKRIVDLRGVAPRTTSYAGGVLLDMPDSDLETKVALDQCTDADEASSSCSAGRVTLDSHLRAVGVRAAEVAHRLGLPDELVRVVQLAGEAHDLGKADPRFQIILQNGDRFAAEVATEPLAKSDGRRAPRGDWPKGMRHEAISASLVRRMLVDDGDAFAGVDHDLLVHLVAAHHGRARPLLPPVVDPTSQQVVASLPDGPSATVASDEALVDWDGPARFDRLCTRYGTWGLALLETVVRLADIGCSEEGT